MFFVKLLDFWILRLGLMQKANGEQLIALWVVCG